MITKFHDTTVVTKFIQQILADNYFPIEKTVYYGDYVVKEVTYIFQTYVVRAKQSGKLSEENFDELLTIVSPFAYGEFYPGLTMNFVSNNSAYDSVTHYYLGQYLRAYRDLQQIDLMPYYNCFTDEYIGSISFSTSKPYLSSIEDNRYKYISVPVKFGKKYSVSMDFAGNVDMRIAFIGKKGLLQSDTEKLVDVFPDVRFSHTYSTMSKPFLFEGLDLEKAAKDVESESILFTLLSKERFLRLILRVPMNYKGSVVVLEGDYQSTNDIQIDLMPYYDSKEISRVKQVIFGNLLNVSLTGEEQVSINNKMLSPLSLIRMSDEFSYPFSDRLIEYLLHLVITSNDDIDADIKTVQETISSYVEKKVNGINYTVKYVPGVWDTNMRNFLYTLSITSPDIQSKFDLNGFVDKDTEQLITRGV